jgi:hypothetical protein
MLLRSADGSPRFSKVKIFIAKIAKKSAKPPRFFVFTLVMEWFWTYERVFLKKLGALGSLLAPRSAGGWRLGGKKPTL